MAIPKTIKALPESCIIISYDAEAVTQTFKPGCTLAFGAVAALWDGTMHPLSNLTRTHPVDTRNLFPQVFFAATQPTVKMDRKTRQFWEQQVHSRVYAWSNSPLAEPIPEAFSRFLAWLNHLGRFVGRPHELVMLARPHRYDARHLVDGFRQIGREAVIDTLLFADCAELFARHHKLKQKEGKAIFKQAFLPHTLLHEPVMDSMVQLNATLAGLLHTGPLPAPPPEP